MYTSHKQELIKGVYADILGRGRGMGLCTHAAASAADSHLQAVIFGLNCDLEGAGGGLMHAYASRAHAHPMHTCGSFMCMHISLTCSGMSKYFFFLKNTNPSGETFRSPGGV